MTRFKHAQWMIEHVFGQSNLHLEEKHRQTLSSFFLRYNKARTQNNGDQWEYKPLLKRKDDIEQGWIKNPLPRLSNNSKFTISTIRAQPPSHQPIHNPSFQIHIILLITHIQHSNNNSNTKSKRDSPSLSRILQISPNSSNNRTQPNPMIQTYETTINYPKNNICKPNNPTPRESRQIYKNPKNTKP